jgi:hypothetical protein
VNFAAAGTRGKSRSAYRERCAPPANTILAVGGGVRRWPTTGYGGAGFRGHHTYLAFLPRFIGPKMRREGKSGRVAVRISPHGCHRFRTCAITKRETGVTSFYRSCGARTLEVNGPRPTTLLRGRCCQPPSLIADSVRRVPMIPFWPDSLIRRNNRNAKGLRIIRWRMSCRSRFRTGVTRGGCPE